MARMPDIFADLNRERLAAEHDVASHLRHLMHHGAPQPAATPPAPQLPHNENQEEHMSFIADAEDHLKAALGKFEQVDHQALDALERVQSNPATAEIFAIAASLTHLPPESLATSLDVLRMTLRGLGGQAPQQQPA